MNNVENVVVKNERVIPFPFKYKDRFIHQYGLDGSKDTYGIALSKDELFNDEEESEAYGISKEDYQEILNKFGAKQFHHEFVYGEGDVKPVQDSYFEDLDKCKEAIKYLYEKLSPVVGEILHNVYTNAEHNWQLTEHRVFDKQDNMIDAELIIVDLTTGKEIDEYVDDVWVYDWELINK